MATWDIVSSTTDSTPGAVQTVKGAPIDKDQLTALILGRFQYADDYRRQYDERAKSWWQLYEGYREQLAEDDPRYGRSNIHVPRPYEILDALRARLVKSFFGQRPYLDFLPLPSGNAQLDRETYEANERKAGLAAALVDGQLERNSIIRKWYDFVTNFLVLPAAVMAVGWRYEERKVRRRVEQPVMMTAVTADPMTGLPAITQVPVIDPMTGQQQTELVEVEEIVPVWDDNELQVVAWEDQWCDPLFSDIDEARFFFHREIATRSQLDAKLQLLKDTGSGKVFSVDWDTVEQNGGMVSDDGLWQRMTSVGVSIDAASEHWGDGERPGKPIEILHYWTDENLGIIVNRKVLVYWGDNPYWRHGKKPYIVASYDPVHGRPYGISAMQIIEGMAHELNTTRNQRIDAVSFGIVPMSKIRRDADIDPDQLIRKPGGIIEVDNFDDVTDMPMQNVPMTAYQEESIIKSDIENALGVAPVVRGVSGGSQETATEIMAKQSNAGIRFEVKIALYQEMAIKRLAMLMDCNNQQFIDDHRWVQLFGAEQMAQWQQVAPGEIIGEYDYRPAGSNIDPAANREVRRQQYKELMEVVWKLNIPYANRYELFRSLVDTFDLRNPAKIVIPWEELMQQAMVQQQQQQQSNMAQGMPPEMIPPQAQGMPMEGVPMQGTPPMTGGGAPV